MPVSLDIVVDLAIAVWTYYLVCIAILCHDTGFFDSEYSTMSDNIVLI